MASIDPELGPDYQDKRSDEPIDVDDVDQRLFATLEQAAGQMPLASVAVLVAPPTQ